MPQLFFTPFTSLNAYLFWSSVVSVCRSAGLCSSSPLDTGAAAGACEEEGGVRPSCSLSVYRHTQPGSGGSPQVCPHSKLLAKGAHTEEEEPRASARDPRRGVWGCSVQYNWTQQISTTCFFILGKKTLPLHTLDSFSTTLLHTVTYCYIFFLNTIWILFAWISCDILHPYCMSQKCINRMFCM